MVRVLWLSFAGQMGTSTGIRARIESSNSALIPTAFAEFCCVAFAVENVIENFRRQRFRFNVVLFYVFVYGVERHVDCGVAEGFDYPAFTPWQRGSKACGSCASPFAKPIDNCVEPWLGGIRVNLSFERRLLGLALSTVGQNSSGTIGQREFLLCIGSCSGKQRAPTNHTCCRRRPSA